MAKCEHGMIPYGSFCPFCHPKGETVPQTVENLQYIMARDAETMMELQRENSRLRQKVNQLQQKLRSRNRPKDKPKTDHEPQVTMC